MKIYYAHCSHLYGTAQEARDLETIVALFGSGHVEVVNPGSKDIADRVEAYKADYAASPTGQYADSSEAVMHEVFKVLVEDADALVFRATSNGPITAGVHREIGWARACGKPVLELPSAISRRGLTVEQTREYLREVGQR